MKCRLLQGLAFADRATWGMSGDIQTGCTCETAGKYEGSAHVSTVESGVLCVLWALVISAALAGGSVAQAEETGREKKPGGIAQEDSPLTNGILPSIGFLFRVPETLQLRYPEEFGTDDRKPPKYGRFFSDWWTEGG